MFSEDDVKKADQFAKTLAKARFDFTVTDWLSFHQQLVWYNSVIKKIQDNVLEVKRVTDPPEETK